MKIYMCEVVSFQAQVTLHHLHTKWLSLARCEAGPRHEGAVTHILKKQNMSKLVVLILF